MKRRSARLRKYHKKNHPSRTGKTTGERRADKQIGMGEPVLRNRIPERARDMRLADQIVKSLWPIFARENFVAHALNLTRRSAKQKQKSPAFGIKRGAAARLTRSLSRIFPNKSFFRLARFLRDTVPVEIRPLVS